MKTLKQILLKVFSFLTSDKGKAALEQAAALVPKAAPIVQKIADASGKRTLAEIASAFAEFGVPFAAEYLALGPGAALLHLATTVLAAEAPGVATSILQTAIQIAYTGGQKKG
jgi:hypothetical protein